MADRTVLIADDHPIVRKGLRETIEDGSGFSVAAEAGNGRDALEAIERLAPAVSILDIDMPVLSGFDVARAVRSRALRTEVVFLTMHRDEEMFNEAIDLGARGFVLKDSALSDIVECLEAVTSGSPYTSHSLTSFLLNRSRRALELAASRPSIGDLTQSERRVLGLLAEDLTTKEIAARLFVSPRTVDKHRENISQKLQLRGPHALYRFVLQNRSKLL